MSHGKVRQFTWIHDGQKRRAWGFTVTVDGKRARWQGYGSRAEAQEALDAMTIPECAVRSSPGGAPEQRRWSAAADPIALMRPLVIVGVHERIQTALQHRPTDEVAPAEGHAPVRLQDRALQPLDEPVGPRMPGFRPRVPKPQGPTGLIEGALELGPAIGEHAAQPAWRYPGSRMRRRK